MLKLVGTIAAASLALIAPAGAQAAPMGPDAATCARDSGPSVLVRVSGFKTVTGNLRVQIYGDNPERFLAKGAKLKRIDLPVTANRMDVCVALPRAGDYAVAVRHDVDGDNAKGDWGDGGGFSRNPNLSLLNLKPDYDEVAISVGGGTRVVDVVMNYRRGLSIGPVRSAR